MLCFFFKFQLLIFDQDYSEAALQDSSPQKKKKLCRSSENSIFPLCLQSEAKKKRFGFRLLLKLMLGWSCWRCFFRTRRGVSALCDITQGLFSALRALYGIHALPRGARTESSSLTLPATLQSKILVPNLMAATDCI